jgi:hypothetical protein
LGTKPIINVAEFGLGERAVMVSDDSGGWMGLHDVEAKACFWAESLDQLTGSIRMFLTKWRRRLTGHLQPSTYSFGTQESRIGVTVVVGRR